MMQKGSPQSESKSSARSLLLTTSSEFELTRSRPREEDLPPPRDEDAYRDREVTFAASFDEEKILNVGQFHNKRVLATGPIYFFPSDSNSPAEVIFMMDDIREYPSQTSKTKQPQDHFWVETNDR
jgi:hypothetical protein